MIRAGVGQSSTHQADLAGTEAARAALDALDGASPHWALLFGTSGHDPHVLLKAVRAVLGTSVELVGCSAEGTITPLGSQESAYAVCVLVVHSPHIRARSFSVEQLSASPEQKGCELGAAVAEAVEADSRLLLLFPDGLTANGSDLLLGLDAQLPEHVDVVGGTAGDMLRFEKTHQFIGDAVKSDAATALLLSGDFDVTLGLSHGCDPVGLERTVTCSEGGYVLEIDGQPAWDVFKEYLDDGSEGLDALNVAYLSMAQRVELDGGARPTLIRNPLALDAERGALFFPGGLPTGARVQIAVRNPERIRDQAVAMARALSADERTPALVLQFDCAGRGRLLFGEHTNTMAVFPLVRALGEDLPWIGFHTYGEIAPIGDRTHFHNYTVVLCTLYDTPRR